MRGHPITSERMGMPFAEVTEPSWCGGARSPSHEVAGSPSPGTAGASSSGAIGALSSEIDRLTPPTSPGVTAAARGLRLTRVCKKATPNTQADSQLRGVQKWVHRVAISE